MLSALYVFIVLNISFSNLLLLPLWNPALSTLSLKLEDLHCTWPFWNMSEPSFVCYLSCCNWMFVWIFSQGCKKSHVLIRTGRKLRSAGWASFFPPGDTWLTGSPPQIDHSFLCVYFGLEWNRPAGEVAGEERTSHARLRLRPCKLSRVTRVQPLTALDRGMDGLVSAAWHLHHVLSKWLWKQQQGDYRPGGRKEGGKHWNDVSRPKKM